MVDGDLTEHTARELTAETGGLRIDVTGLSSAIEKMEKRQDDQERRGKVLLWAFGLGILIVLLLALAVSGNYRNAVKLDRVTSLGVCPSAAIIVGSSFANARPAEAQDDYIRAVDSLARAREALGCTDPLIPPRAVR